MKKTLVIFLFIMLVVMQESLSQNSRPIVPDNVKILQPGNGFLNSISTRAIRDFVCKYEKATDVVWYGLKDEFIVRFAIDSVQARAAYKPNGLWMYTIKQYLEDKMPRSVRHVVKSRYYDYSITLVEEIEVPNESVRYLVHLQDDVSWKNVLVSDGQLELVEDRKKL